MRLYSYSSDLHTFVEAKLARTTIAAGGILIGTLLLLGIMELNQSVGNAVGSRSASALTSENDLLRQQISLISPRLNNLELQTGQLEVRSNELRKLLRHRKSYRDTALQFTNATERSKIQSSMAAAKDPLP